MDIETVAENEPSLHFKSHERNPGYVIPFHGRGQLAGELHIRLCGTRANFGRRQA